MKPVIYLDNAATSWPKPPGVEQAIRRFLAEDAGNPGRSAHRMAVACERMMDQLRVRLNRLFDGDDPDRTVFTLNATDALNMAIKGVLRPGDHAITTVLEHNSVSRPLQAMADAGTIALTRVGDMDNGLIDSDAIAAAINSRTRLIVCSHCSNVIGTIQPIEQIGRIARQRGVLFLVDAAQSAGLVPISMGEQCIDLLAVPGHKSLLGPTGTGVLLVGNRADLRPWREGGTGGDSASPNQPVEYPHHLEGGTPNTVGLAGLVAGLDEVERRGLAAILQHERALARQLVDALADDRRFTVLASGDIACRTGVISFTIEDIAPQDVASMLDASFGIAVRAGLHCAPYLHQALGTFPSGAVRVSPGPYSTAQDIAALVNALRAIVSASAE